jgi:hypothetical protein
MSSDSSNDCACERMRMLQWHRSSREHCKETRLSINEISGQVHVRKHVERGNEFCAREREGKSRPGITERSNFPVIGPRSHAVLSVFDVLAG